MGVESVGVPEGTIRLSTGRISAASVYNKCTCGKYTLIRFGHSTRKECVLAGSESVCARVFRRGTSKKK